MEHDDHGTPDDEALRASAPRRLAGRGGGPPGGSAFRRLFARDRQEEPLTVRRISATPAPQVVIAGLDADAPASPEAPTTTDGLRTSAATDGPLAGTTFDPTWISRDDHWEDLEADALRTDDPSPPPPDGDPVGGRPSEEATASSTSEPEAPPRRIFPGGAVRLPRLDGADEHVQFVGTAFVRRDDETSTTDRSAFDEYFTFESLFEAPTEETEEDGPLNPYRVLGVEPGSPWREVVAAHRKLVKLHHPDRLVDADRATVAAAEERLRQINWAYGELARYRQQ